MFRHTAKAAARHDLDEIRAVFDLPTHRLKNGIRTVHFNRTNIAMRFMATGRRDAKPAYIQPRAADDTRLDSALQRGGGAAYGTKIAHGGDTAQQLIPCVPRRIKHTMRIGAVFNGGSTLQENARAARKIPAVNVHVQIGKPWDQIFALRTERFLPRQFFAYFCNASILYPDIAVIRRAAGAVNNVAVLDNHTYCSPFQ
ncbi:hypothetical protein SDC9_178400 [bioreactor metagenome]|uniref:Uncharacterized protein n=1 Tax=bioreactor metagenome TaxID=1076179 RepID=A0A645GYX2_9ZZZZ